MWVSIQLPAEITYFIITYLLVTILETYEWTKKKDLQQMNEIITLEISTTAKPCQTKCSESGKLTQDLYTGFKPIIPDRKTVLIYEHD